MKLLLLNYTKSPMPKKRLTTLAEKLSKNFAQYKVFKKKLSQVPGIEDLSIVFVTPQKSKWLNGKFRKKNRPTDVLSFKAEENFMGLGELVLCPSVLSKQAKEHQHSLEKETDLMIIHGFLHLLGYDHEKNLKEEQRMMKIQNILFKKLSK